ncbi:MAG TPA: copper amine oxidase N-terminal domain-containing protein [Armatimonadota bacterium]|jgi:N-acetylmuramoyl-L-alanine amidase
MKKSIVCLALLALAAGAALAATQVLLFANGKQIKADPGVVIQKNVAYVPLRAAGEALGAKIEWNNAKKVARVCQGAKCVMVKSSDGIMQQGRLLLPIRKLGESLGATVNYTHGSPPRIDISTAPRPSS